MNKHPVQTYFEGLQAVRGTGKATDEQSFKSKLEALLTAIGENFDPRLFATMELKQDGAGQPDLGIFEKKSQNLRLVVEVKGTKDSINETASGDQVSKYWARYGFVLVTNFREFVLVARDHQTGMAAIEARYQITSTSDAFWHTKASALAAEHEQGLKDFIEGVFARPSPILKPKDLASDLARHAREAKRRLARHSIEDLKPLQDAFRKTLGLTFNDEQGIRFFRSSIVQTLFYGLFSGWMLWRTSSAKDKNSQLFDWHKASEYLDLPLIAALFEEVAKPTRLKNLDLREPVEWATASLNRVHDREFFASFDADHAITLFYEPFLKAFDPALREELGVWYTPPEIVHYMVERVDKLLRSELKIKDGLADENVYVLDPAAGTGSFLIHTARRIHKTLVEQGHEPLAAAMKVQIALRDRIFGFEILTAPYVVAHLQLGLLLKAFGAKLADDDRVSVFLTNALTGWEPAKGVKETLPFHFLQIEQDQAAHVKLKEPILVVIGNPPYRGNKGVALEEEADLVQRYKAGLNEKYGIRKQNLDDPYIRFFGLAERRIAEIGKRGIVCYISNYSWLNGIPHVIMRERLLRAFDSIYIDNLHGDRKARECAPDGTASETVFAMRGSSPGIKIGTAIATMVKTRSESLGPPNNDAIARVEFRDFDDAKAGRRRQRLLASLDNRNEGKPQESAPSPQTRWSLFPGRLSAMWQSWPSLPNLMGGSFKGVQPGRGRALVSIDRKPLEQQMRSYFDKSVSDADLREAYPDLMKNEARYNAPVLRSHLLRKGETYNDEALIPCAWQPFDIRYMYWQAVGKLLNEKRVDFKDQCWNGNLFLAATQKPRYEHFPIPVVIAQIGSYYFFDPYATYFPMRRRQGSLMGKSIGPGMNEKWLKRICSAHNVKPFSKDDNTWTDRAMELNDIVFFHVAAVLSAPDYANSNMPALRINWPSIPVPNDPDILKESAALGRQLSELLMPQCPVEGVTVGKLRASLSELAIPFILNNRQIDPDIDLLVNGGWASVDKQGRISAREGKVTRNVSNPLGAVDVWINEYVGWRNIPLDVWNFTLGGYPVVKKWLSYRENQVLRRPLAREELLYVTDMIRRLSATLELSKELNDIYARCAKCPPVQR